MVSSERCRASEAAHRRLVAFAPERAWNVYHITSGKTTRLYHPFSLSYLRCQRRVVIGELNTRLPDPSSVKTTLSHLATTGEAYTCG
jgi:hypothetical protein